MQYYSSHRPRRSTTYRTLLIGLIVVTLALLAYDLWAYEGLFW